MIWNSFQGWHWTNICNIWRFVFEYLDWILTFPCYVCELLSVWNSTIYQSVVEKAVENDSFLMHFFLIDYTSNKSITGYIMGYIYDLSASCKDSFSNIRTKYFISIEPDISDLSFRSCKRVIYKCIVDSFIESDSIFPIFKKHCWGPQLEAVPRSNWNQQTWYKKVSFLCSQALRYICVKWIPCYNKWFIFVFKN